MAGRTNIARASRPYAPRMAPEDRREQLLDAVLRVIVDQGVHKVSIDTVARAAGVSRPVVYGLFDDSDHLLRASLDREEAAALAQLADAVPKAGTDPTGALSVAFVNFLAAVQASPDRWRAAFRLVDSSTPAFRRRLDRGRIAFVGALETFLRTAIAEEDDDGVDIALAARTMFALFWDAGRLVLADPGAYPAQRLIAFADLLLPAAVAALCGTPAPPGWSTIRGGDV